MPTQEELKFSSLRSRIQKLIEDRSRRLGELDGLKARLRNEFKCETLEEARTLHKQLQEQLVTEGKELGVTLSNLEREVAEMEERVRT